ncbi:MAG: S46 family peptidase, partial [Bacteroidales bacterium]|nr:S46 family peptidase [Bacteroidales bacterium]
EGGKYDAQVIDMFNGNQFFLLVYVTYKDVRLVGAPPSSMGKFGGDTDNWSWPRHTCDFSMFRIYTAPDGSPAKYSAENVPLKPKHHLPVSIKELNNGDYAMVMGYPGTTNHFITSYGLQETMDITNKLRYEIRTVKINVLREQMAASQATRIKYASKYASCSNYWKYSHEQNIALKNLNTMGVKKDIEKEYLGWSRDKAPKYGQALDLLKKGYADRAPYQVALQYIVEGLLDGGELPWEAYRWGLNIVRALDEETNSSSQEHILNAVKSMAEGFYKDYDQETEMKLESALYKYVVDNMQFEYCPEMLTKANEKYKGDFNKYVAKMFEKSVFASPERFNKFMEKPKAKAIKNDPIFLMGEAIYNAYIKVYKSMPQDANDNIKRGQRDFTDGILQINAKKGILQSPDANSTIRLTYGNVKAYDPRDAVSYKHYTTLKGVIEKEQPSGEFEVPQRLKDLYFAHDFGPYANSKGELPTCFITNNDITGGNSGSPVIDADGNLIGLAFDGNSEAMSGDLDFEENLQRCICLDTRYMLWVIDKFAGAYNLIEEMDIVK